MNVIVRPAMTPGDGALMSSETLRRLTERVEYLSDDVRRCASKAAEAESGVSSVRSEIDDLERKLRWHDH